MQAVSFENPQFWNIKSKSLEAQNFTVLDFVLQVQNQNDLNKNLREDLSYGYRIDIIHPVLHVLHGGNKGDCLHAPWSLPWCP